MKSQRKKKLLKTIKNVAIIASITAATLKLSSFFKKESEIWILEKEIGKIQGKIKILQSSVDELKSKFDNHYHEMDDDDEKDFPSIDVDW